MVYETKGDIMNKTDRNIIEYNSQKAKLFNDTEKYCAECDLIGGCSWSGCQWCILNCLIEHTQTALCSEYVRMKVQ